MVPQLKGQVQEARYQLGVVVMGMGKRNPGRGTGSQDLDFHLHACLHGCHCLTDVNLAYKSVRCMREGPCLILFIHEASCEHRTGGSVHDLKQASTKGQEERGML